MLMQDVKMKNNISNGVDLYWVHNDRIELHLSDIIKTTITVIKNATNHETIEKSPNCFNNLINDHIHINQSELSTKNSFDENCKKKNLILT